MNDILLGQVSDEELARAVEENLFALFRAMARLPGAEIVEGSTHSYHHAFPASPMFHGAWRTRLSAGEADGAIAATLGWFKTRGAKAIFWWDTPGTTPTDLGARLHAQGFGPAKMEDPGMAAPLASLPDTLSTPEGFEIRQAHDQQTLEDWRDVFCAAHQVPAFSGQSWADATLRFAPAEAPWKMYTGYLEGRPVASSFLFLGAGVAGIYGVGTLQEARGRGIGAAITVKPLLDARAAGYHHGVLFASQQGYAVYKRLGFRELPCRMGRYLWRQQ